MAKIDEILTAAVEKRASDIHFSAEEPVWARVDGDLTPFSEQRFSAQELESLLREILKEEERDTLSRNKNLDKSYLIDGVGNFRVNVFYSRRGIGSVIRTLPSKMPTIEQLGLPPVVKRLAELPKGLILVTGPTGSGKSTTLAAIINHMNENFPYHILTAEDPVEFIHRSKTSLINQREIGQSCPTFADALKYALREDPDVILVGEMRDLETISLALTAAETGHLVLGTLHTRGAASTMDRIIESFPAIQQAMVRAMLAESLQAVISQSLLKHSRGSGRVAVYEIMVMNYAISNLVREGKTFQVPSIIQTARREGMMLMTAHARELAAAGEVTQEEADELISSLSRGHTTGSGASSGASAGGGPPSLSPPGAGSGSAKPPPVAAPTMPKAPPVPQGVVQPSAPEVQVSATELSLDTGTESVEALLNSEVLDEELSIEVGPVEEAKAPAPPIPPPTLKPVAGSSASRSTVAKPAGGVLAFKPLGPAKPAPQPSPKPPTPAPVAGVAAPPPATPKRVPGKPLPIPTKKAG